MKPFPTSARGHRLPAVHRRHDRRFQGRDAHASQHPRQHRAGDGNLRNALGGETPVIVTALPLYHIFSLTVNCLLMAKMGGCNLLITNPRDIPGFIKELAKHRYNMITRREHAVQRACSTTRISTSSTSRTCKISVGGGMAVQKAVADRWKQVTGKVLISRATASPRPRPVATMNPPSLTEYNGSIGLPVPSTVDRHPRRQQEGPAGRPAPARSASRARR